MEKSFVSSSLSSSSSAKSSTNSLKQKVKEWTNKEIAKENTMEYLNGVIIGNIPELNKKVYCD